MPCEMKGDFFFSLPFQHHDQPGLSTAPSTFQAVSAPHIDLSLSRPYWEGRASLCKRLLCPSPWRTLEGGSSPGSPLLLNLHSRGPPAPICESDPHSPWGSTVLAMNGGSLHMRSSGTGIAHSLAMVIYLQISAPQILQSSFTPLRCP